MGDKWRGANILNQFGDSPVQGHLIEGILFASRIDQLEFKVRIFL
jgi:hypothetical protein